MFGPRSLSIAIGRLSLLLIIYQKLNCEHMGPQRLSFIKRFLSPLLDVVYTKVLFSAYVVSMEEGSLGE